jgi:hypothetical protein
VHQHQLLQQLLRSVQRQYLRFNRRQGGAEDETEERQQEGHLLQQAVSASVERLQRQYLRQLMHQ